jgi:hypothetical protein
LKEADVAEERIVEEMRLLGREALRSWVENRVDTMQRDIHHRPQMYRQGEKTALAYENRRNRGRGASPKRPGAWWRGEHAESMLTLDRTPSRPAQESNTLRTMAASWSLVSGFCIHATPASRRP